VGQKQTRGVRKATCGTRRIGDLGKKTLAGGKQGGIVTPQKTTGPANLTEEMGNQFHKIKGEERWQTKERKRRLLQKRLGGSSSRRSVYGTKNG